MDRRTGNVLGAATGSQRRIHVARLLLTGLALAMLPGCRASGLPGWCVSWRPPDSLASESVSAAVESESPGAVESTEVRSRANSAPGPLPIDGRHPSRSVVPRAIPSVGQSGNSGQQLTPHRERFRRLQSALRETETGPVPPPPPVPRDFPVAEIRLAGAKKNTPLKARRWASDENPWAAASSPPARVTPPVIRLPDISDWGEARITRVSHVSRWFRLSGSGMARWTLVAPVVLGALIGLFWWVGRRKTAAEE